MVQVSNAGEKVLLHLGENEDRRRRTAWSLKNIHSEVCTGETKMVLERV